LIRIYTKRKGQPPQLADPLVLSCERRGVTVESACESVSRELLDVFHYAYVWGR
jgi:ribosome-interacting GTPase 1